jgi:hypothetical protein
MVTSIIAIGNPGAGKSTILNALAGERIFKSGISFGQGLTYELDKGSNIRGNFYDTPGLADDSLRKKAAEAIRDALREGGPFKLLFFVMQEAGRVVRQDVTTLKLVLDATPEIGNNYGVVINKVPENVAKGLSKPQNAQIFLTKLFYGIDEDKKCASSNITYLLSKTDLDSVDNVLINLDNLRTLQGENFETFVYGNVPTVNLTPGQANDIAFEDFDDMTTKMENMTRKMEEDRASFLKAQEELMEQFRKAEKDKEEQRERDQERHAEQIKIFQEQIEEKQKAIELSQNDSAAKMKLEREAMELKMKQQQEEHRRQLERLASEQRKGRPCLIM